MKKFLFMAAMAALTLVSCNQDDQNMVKADTPNEMSIYSVSSAQTKGYVPTSAFRDITGTKLHKETAEAGDSTYREMLVSAYMKPVVASGTGSASEAANYFVSKKFTRNDTDGKWHATPAVYWPVSTTVDLLAYSVATPFNAADVEWDATNASNRVTFNVLENYSQDDIIYAGKSDVASSTGATAVGMKFAHAQAWLSFRILANKKDLISVKRVVIENIYNTGSLTINNDNTVAEVGASATWNFRHETKKDVDFDDINGLYGSIAEDTPWAVSNALDTLNIKDANPVYKEKSYLDMLIPEQTKTSFVIEYYLAGQPTLLRYRFTLAEENWNMNEHYVYEVNFTINEMTIAPTVKEYADGNVTDLSGSII